MKEEQMFERQWGTVGGAVIFADSNEKGVHRRERKKLEGTDGLCVCDGLFLWGSVCVFQLWTVDYARIHEDVYLLVSLSLFLCQSADTDFKLLYSKRGGQCGDSTHISLVTPYTI